MATIDHIDMHERRAREAVRAAVVGQSGNHKDAADELLDDMLAGRVAVSAVVSGLVHLVNHLVAAIESGEASDLDLDQTIHDMLER